MATAQRHRWQFAARFRQSGFGWRSQPAIRESKAGHGQIV